VTEGRPLLDRPLVYVAGPYTRGDPVLNTRRAIEFASGLLDAGLVTPVVPHLNLLWQLVAPHEDVEHWYDYDLAVLARCDALYRMGGPSVGADREVVFAGERQILVFLDLESLGRWAKGWGRCVALTRKGQRCANRPMAGSDRCGPHADLLAAAGDSDF
jgi:hypothetical protein